MPPREFDTFLSTQLPAMCYVELFLEDLQYVSGFKEKPLVSSQTLLGEVWDMSPLLRNEWGEFKETFGVLTSK